MKIIEIVETIEKIEGAVSDLSESKLALLETILEEGSDIQFNAEYHIDYLVEFVDSLNDENAEIISETVNGEEILSIILETAQKHPENKEVFLNETIAKVEDIEIDINEDIETEEISVPLLSVVTNALTEMLGESVVEEMPVEMVFDITEEVKDFDINEDSTLNEMIEEITENLSEAIESGSIDLDTDDYDCESLAEFLSDYDDTEDLLEEMKQVTPEILAEAVDEDGAVIMEKAKNAMVLLEKKYERCTTKKCQQAKAKAAKKWFEKNSMTVYKKGGEVEEINPKDFKLNKLGGKLGKHVKAAAKAARKNKKALTPEYIQYVLVPGIIKRMRRKNKSMKKSDNVKKAGMK